MAITREQAFTESAFHIHHPGRLCTIWNRAVIYADPGGEYFTICLFSGNNHMDITPGNLDAFHLAGDCPDALVILPDSDRSEDQPPASEDDDEAKPDACELDLAQEWGDFASSRWNRPDAFLEHLREIVCDPDEIEHVQFCDNCGRPEWDEDLNPAQAGEVSICDSCLSEWPACDRCDDRFPRGELHETLHDTDVCEHCRDNYYSYCEDCDGYYGDNSDHYHDDDECGCESPQTDFAIRNDGDGPLASDTHAVITLAAGVISDTGLRALRDYLNRQELWGLASDLEPLGNQWQTKGSNYAKRLSRHAYQAHQVKLTPDVLSGAGTIARDHSNQVSVRIAVTRDLNMDAEAFWHSGSCWWGSYSESRCALKTNGGFGLRSFDSSGEVSGRAWVMPLKLGADRHLVPTFETLAPDAFVIFNGYGDLDGYAAPRIIAHMAGWTYRKIAFDCEPMYINAGGYLVAAEEIAAPYTDGSLSLEASQHARLFYTERELVNA